jgi:membrane complex biogenesis BtpA family protein
MPTILARAVADARAYERAGFGAVIVENFGDAPFFPRRVPPETVAALAVAARAVREAVSIPVGVNCLRNDGIAAMAIAAASGLQFIRVNVYVGAAVADQGLLEGEAHEIARARARLAPDTKILADVGVKHAAALAHRAIEDEARDAVERGLADGIVVTGSRTGEAPTADRLRSVAAALRGAAPVLLGSGLDVSNANDLLAIAAGAIVGTSVKRGRVTTNPVDPARACALVAFAMANKRRRAPG